MASLFSLLTGSGSGGEAPTSAPPNWTSSTGETLNNVKESWTTDGKDPIIVWHGNAHGATNNLNNQRQHKHERKHTPMVVDGFAIAGNENQCGFMDKVNPLNGSLHPEFKGKGIDYCIPELLTSIFLDCEEKKLDPNTCFDTAIHKVMNLYHDAGLYQHLNKNGGFKQMTDPTLYHYYQLFANPGENDRGETGRPMRAAAGDAKHSQSEIYGIWIVYTNIELLKHLSLTYIRSLLGVREHPFLPPEELNRINMAGRKNRTPIGALYWMNAIRDLEKYDSLTPGNEIKTSRIRALIALNNLWKTRLTNLHDILDIFTPFNIVGRNVGINPIRVRTIDVTCRTDIGKLVPPDPAVPLVPTTWQIDSVGSFTANKTTNERTTTKGPALEKSGHGGEEAMPDGDEATPGGEEAMPDGDEATQVYNNAIKAQEDDKFYDDGERGEEEDEEEGGLGNMSERDNDEWVDEPEEEETYTPPSSRAVGAVTNPVYGKKNGSKKKKRGKSGVKKRSQKPTLRVNKSDSVLATLLGVGNVVSLKLKPTPRDPRKLLQREGIGSPDMGGAKRKYSRKRNTRTRNRYTRTRNRYTRRRTPR